MASKTPTVTIRYAAGSEAGVTTKHRESAYADPSFMAVVDGAVGHRSGESAQDGDMASGYASKVVIDALESACRRIDPDQDDLLSALSGMVSHAGERLADAKEALPWLGPVATTLTATLWRGSSFALTHVGDSRGYLLRSGELFRITQDHTMEALLEAEAERTGAAVEASGLTHRLYRQLDGRPDLVPDLALREAQLGDRYLLCSAGLARAVSPEPIWEVLTRESDPSGAVRRLSELAREAGLASDVTCAVIDVAGEDGSGVTGAPVKVGAALLPPPRPVTDSPSVQPPKTVELPAVGMPLAPQDPQQVAGYRILRRLGEGGMGRVYLAMSRGGRRVALKVILPHLADSPGFRARFDREVEAAGKVSGVFSAPVLDADPRAAEPWLATLYIPGPSLREAVLDHGPLPSHTLDVLAAGLAEALVAIHGADLVHRDLKPSNILLAADGPRVIDFGIVRAAAGRASDLTRTGTRIGTPEYMSPEQFRGDRVGPATDVFSLAAVLVFAATGRPPFGRGAPEELGYRVVHTEPDLTKVPDLLRPLVAACLDKEPRLRPVPARLLEMLEDRLPDFETPWLPPELGT